MSMQMERMWARLTRLFALGLWGAVGAVNLPALTSNVGAAHCADACYGCSPATGCIWCGEVNGVYCYDPKGS